MNTAQAAFTQAAFKQAWPGPLPSRRLRLALKHTYVERDEVLEVKPAEIVLVEVGWLLEVAINPHNGNSIILRELRDGALSVHRHGVMRARARTRVLIVGEGWQDKEPDMVMVAMAEVGRYANELGDLTLSLATTEVRERVKRYIAKHPEDMRLSPSIVAQHVGASREMCSRVLSALRAEQEREGAGA